MPGDIPTTRSAHLHARLRLLTDHAPRRDGLFVLFWMQQARRLHWNHALQHAVYRAREHNVPLLIVEDLCLDQRWTQLRHFHFALQGMRDQRAALAGRRDVYYLPWIERRAGQLATALPRLLASVVEVVTDEVPCGVPVPLVRALAGWADDLGVRATAVDSNGVLPIRLLDAAKPTAAVFRRYLHRHASAALAGAPVADPLHGQIATPPFEPAWISHALAERTVSGSRSGPMTSRAMTPMKMSSANPMSNMQSLGPLVVFDRAFPAHVVVGRFVVAVLRHALAKALDRAAQIRAQCAQAFGAEQHDDDHENDQQLPDTDTTDTHNALPLP